MNIADLKIALIKQDVYQDLYVCSTAEKDSGNILLSSQMRVGPIGLFHNCNCDFFIVKEEMNPETQIYRYVIPHKTKMLRLLKTHTLNNIAGHSDYRPGSTHPNGDFSIDAGSINWGEYDVVISINVSLPTYIVTQYRSTLFAYMIGEANIAISKPRFGYDVSLNQMARGIIYKTCGEIDFPYTFLNGTTLQEIMKNRLERESKKEGIFMEVNSTIERPVRHIPEHFKPLKEKGYKIWFHDQSIIQNLTNLYDSKYFIKYGGRTIRGNSVAEAISAGSLAIMNRDEITHKELIIEECDVKSMEDILRLLKELEADNHKYQELLEKQRTQVSELFFEKPILSLINCLEEKRSIQKEYTGTDKINDRLFLLLMSAKAKTRLLKRHIKNQIKTYKK